MQSGTPQQAPSTAGVGQAPDSSKEQGNSPATAQQTPTVQGGETGTPDARGTGASAGERQSEVAGSISGTVVVQTGASAVGAQVRLTREGQSPNQEGLSGDNGEYSFANVPPGPFRITIRAPGFAPHEFEGALRPGEDFIVPEIMLSVTTDVTEVRVGATPYEVAEEQIKEQEKQRVLGIVPNFYVTYVPDAAPLAPKQKFELA